MEKKRVFISRDGVSCALAVPKINFRAWRRKLPVVHFVFFCNIFTFGTADSDDVTTGSLKGLSKLERETGCGRSSGGGTWNSVSLSLSPLFLSRGHTRPRVVPAKGGRIEGNQNGKKSTPCWALESQVVHRLSRADVIHIHAVVLLFLYTTRIISIILSSGGPSWTNVIGHLILPPPALLSRVRKRVEFSSSVERV